MLRYVYGGDISAAKWKDYGKDLLEAADKYGMSKPLNQMLPQGTSFVWLLQ